MTLTEAMLIGLVAVMAALFGFAMLIWRSQKTRIAALKKEIADIEHDADMSFPMSSFKLLDQEDENDAGSGAQ